MRSRFTPAYFLLIILSLTYFFFGFSDNPPDGRTGAPAEGLCSDCHSGGGGFDGEILITGLPENLEADSIYSLTVTVTNPNGEASLAGFQMTALNQNDAAAGEFSEASENAGIDEADNRQYVDHRPAQNFGSENEVKWTVNWAAPSDLEVGDQITWYAAGNIANGNGNNSGDRIVTKTETREAQSTVFSSLSAAMQDKITIYPNPAYTNNYIKIRLSGTGIFDVAIFDLNGRIIEEKKSIDQETSIPLNGWMKGMYLAEVKKGKEKMVKRFIIQ